MIEDYYIKNLNVAASIRRMAIALKEKWDHLATAVAEYSDEDNDEDDEEGGGV